MQPVSQQNGSILFQGGATELGTWDYNPANGKFSANPRLKSWFGLRAEEEIDLAIVIEAMAPGDR